MIGQWTVIGDFRPVLIGNFLRRKVTYISTSDDSCIQKFTILAYGNGSILLQAKARNSVSCEVLVQAVENAKIGGISQRKENSVQLITSHTALMSKFIGAISSIESTFDIIQAECSNMLLLSFDPYDVPIWVTEGNFLINASNDHNFIVNRTLFLENTHSSHRLKTIKLFGHWDGTFRLLVEPRNSEGFSQLTQAVILAGFEVPDLIDRTLECITLSHITLFNLQRVVQFLHALKNVAPEIQDAEQIISNAIQNAIEQTFASQAFALDWHSAQNLIFPPPPTDFSFFIANPFLYLGADNLFQTASDNLQYALHYSFEQSYFALTAPPPDPGTNERRVEDLQKKYATKHKSNMKIPDRFHCALVNIVMTHPVSLPETPKERYEKSQILHWLASNPTHPLTRSPLRKEQLVPDEKLEKEINQFIEKKEKQLNQPSLLPHFHNHKKWIGKVELHRVQEEAERFLFNAKFSRKR